MGRLISIPLKTLAGDGEIVFDLEPGSAMIGTLKAVRIPDEAAKARFDHYASTGNPGFILKVGGNDLPSNPRKHLDCIINICGRLFEEGVPGWDFVPPQLNVAPPGDVW